MNHVGKLDLVIYDKYDLETAWTILKYRHLEKNDGSAPFFCPKDSLTIVGSYFFWSDNG